MLLNRSAIQSISVAYNDAFVQGMDTAYPDKDLYKQLAYVAPSTAKTEEFGWLAQVPRIREWIGDRHIGNIARYAMTVTNRKFESSLHLQRDEVEDESWLQKVNLALALGEEVDRHKNELVMGLLQSGFTTLGYDGQTFFNANHPVVSASGATNLVSNFQAGAGNPWYLMDLTSSVFRPIVYTNRREFGLRAMLDEQDEQVFMRDEFRWGVDGRCGAGFALWQKAYASRQALSATNFDAAVQSMMQVTRDGGGPAAVRATHLVCGPSNRAAAKALLNTEQTAIAIGTGGAAVSNYNYGAVQLIVTPYLP